MMPVGPIPAPAPFLRHDGHGASPIVVAVPHAGRHYPPAIEAVRAAPWAVIEQMEDRHADRLIGPLLAAGATGIVATHARAWIDLNRGEEDRHSARERGGLGLIPSRLGGRALWRTAPTDHDVADRLTTVHAPYHQAIADALLVAVARHGMALLIDCHSMPPLARHGARAARIVVGDRHGTTAGQGVAAAAIGVARRHGLPAALNAPYAGAYSVQRHGRPADAIHALQVEIDRSLYLDATLQEPTRGIAAIGMVLAEIASAALATARSILPLAAE